MDLILQDPTDAETTYLIEAILQAASGASAGGGGFAFASSSGVSLLFGNDDFSKFLEEYEFDLIVGTDAVTNPKALERLAQAQESFPKLRVRAFLNSKAGSLFHPKFCWFSSAKGGVVIAGSGNLTLGGLRGNWEAFTSTQVNVKDMAKVRASWLSWIESSAGALRAIDDPEVIERASQNVNTAVVIKKALEQVGVEIQEVAEEAVEDVGPQPDESAAVLIAEISKSKDRWKQANFHKAIFRDYFGATSGAKHSVLLYHIEDDETLPEVAEQRPAVSVKSRNFRFELEAAAHLPYPDVGRPIGIFVKVATRTFWYELLMPDQQAHITLAAFLDHNYPHVEGRRVKMRQIVISFDLLEELTPESPLVKLARKNS